MELLSDNIKPTIMSLLFFLTIFRTQFNATFFVAVVRASCCFSTLLSHHPSKVLLLFSKAVHWVTESRVHFMEQVRRGCGGRCCVDLSAESIGVAADVLEARTADHFALVHRS